MSEEYDLGLLTWRGGVCLNPSDGRVVAPRRRRFGAAGSCPIHLSRRQTDAHTNPENHAGRRHRGRWPDDGAADRRGPRSPIPRLQLRFQLLAGTSWSALSPILPPTALPAAALLPLALPVRPRLSVWSGLLPFVKIVSPSPWLRVRLPVLSITPALCLGIPTRGCRALTGLGVYVPDYPGRRFALLGPICCGPLGAPAQRTGTEKGFLDQLHRIYGISNRHCQVTILERS